MKLRLKKKWMEVCRDLPLAKQILFLQESFVLFEKHPNRIFPLSLSLMIAGLVLIVYSFGLTGRLVIVGGIAIYLWHLYVYLVALSKFVGRWEK